MAQQIPDDSIVVRNARLAVKMALMEKEALGLPAAKYDQKTGQVFLVYPDGRKELMGTRLRKGRYSDRIKQKT